VVFDCRLPKPDPAVAQRAVPAPDRDRFGRFCLFLPFRCSAGPPTQVPARTPRGRSPRA